LGLPTTAYLRTSSAANVEGDSADRQCAAIRTYAMRNDIEVVQELIEHGGEARPFLDRIGARHGGVIEPPRRLLPARAAGAAFAR
jgi:Resolvase, N terminal domain